MSTQDILPMPRFLAIRLDEFMGSKGIPETVSVREQLRELINMPTRPACTWEREADTGAYASACGSLWHYTDGGTPQEHGQSYCHHCGKPISLEGEPDA